MSVFKRLAVASICFAFLLPSGAANAISRTPDHDSSKRIQKLLSDHPGSATALTAKQKAEIKAFVKKAKGKETFVCTGLSLTGQRESMYRVVRLRAELVCQYAKSLDSELATTIKEKFSKKNYENGRVLVSSY
jgi:hypothetical protein